jgi:hypothetical protein
MVDSSLLPTLETASHAGDTVPPVPTLTLIRVTPVLLTRHSTEDPLPTFVCATRASISTAPGSCALPAT